MAFGVGNSVGGFIYGRLLGLVNYNIVVIGNVILHAGVMLFLLVWEREPDNIVLFFVPSIWGFCVGAWLAINVSKFL